MDVLYTKFNKCTNRYKIISTDKLLQFLSPHSLREYILAPWHSLVPSHSYKIDYLKLYALILPVRSNCDYIFNSNIYTPSLALLRMPIFKAAAHFT